MQWRDTALSIGGTFIPNSSTFSEVAAASLHRSRAVAMETKSVDIRPAAPPPHQSPAPEPFRCLRRRRPPRQSLRAHARTLYVPGSTGSTGRRCRRRCLYKPPVATTTTTTTATTTTTTTIATTIVMQPTPLAACLGVGGSGALAGASGKPPLAALRDLAQ